MKKEKILVLMPYGMCLRQIILNECLWSYLTENYDIEIISPIKIDLEILDSNKIRNLNNNKFIKRFMRSLSSKSMIYYRASLMTDFFLENDLGENFALRWKWFKEYVNQIIILSGLARMKFIGYLVKKILIALSYLYPLGFLFNKRYKAIIITHASDIDCTLFGIASNKLNIPLISITLGLDNYRHGPLVYKPDLALLWGNEQVKEFKEYHLSHNSTLSNTDYKKIGSLIHDTYLKVQDSDSTDYLNQKFLLNKKDKLILIATMLEYNLPNQTALCDLILDFLDQHGLDHKLIIRKIPNADNDIWSSYYDLNSGRVYIQEPESASFDKRSNDLGFDITSSMRDIGELVQTLNQVDLIIGHYPSTLLVDGKLFNKPCCVPMFDWKNSSKGGHPQEKFYLSKALSHPHNDNYGLLYSKDDFFEYLYKILVEKDDSSQQNLFDEITGVSYKGESGKIGSEAIEAFLGNLPNKK